MTPEQLKAAEHASESCVTTLAHGISGIGNLLACTASNSETGLNPEALTDIGWLLESLGNLISNLADTGAAANSRLAEIKPGE